MSVENPPNIVFADLSAAADALEISADFLRQSLADIQRVRWAVIAAHAATQCFMVCALKGSDGVRPLNQERKDVKQFIEGLRDYPRTERFPRLPRRALDTFPGLYAKVKDPSPGGMGQSMISQAFEPEPGEDEQIGRLNSLRNKFLHFEPGAWILDPAFALPALRSALRLVAFLAFESNNVSWVLHKELKAKVAGLLAHGTGSLDRLSTTYSATLS